MELLNATDEVVHIGIFYARKCHKIFPYFNSSNHLFNYTDNIKVHWVRNWKINCSISYEKPDTDISDALHQCFQKIG